MGISLERVALFPRSAINYPSLFGTACALFSQVIVLRPIDLIFEIDHSEPFVHDYYRIRQNQNADSFWYAIHSLTERGLVIPFETKMDVQSIVRRAIRPGDVPELQRDFVENEIALPETAALWFSVGFHEFREFIERGHVPLVLSQDERLDEEYRGFTAPDLRSLPDEVATICQSCVPILRFSRNSATTLPARVSQIREDLEEERIVYLSVLEDAVCCAALAGSPDPWWNRHTESLLRNRDIWESFIEKHHIACTRAGVESRFASLADVLIMGWKRCSAQTTIHFVFPSDEDPTTWSRAQRSF